jgi:N-glycosidase YbiA
MEENRKKVIKFYGKDHPLSNFYEAPFRIGSFIFPTVEHYYQSNKSSDFYERIDILMADSPKEAKEMGREAEFLRDNWDDRRIVYMWNGLKAKFTQNDKLTQYLLSTGDAELVENSPYDSFWGRGKDWNGRNMLGKMLMKLRDYIRDENNKDKNNKEETKKLRSVK